MAGPVVTTGDLISAADWNGLSLGVLDETKRTSDFATSSTSFVDLGSVSVSSTMDAGRKVKLTATWPSATHSAPGRYTIEIVDASGTRLQAVVVRNGSTDAEGGRSFSATGTPSSGSKSWKLRVAATDAGTVTITGDSTNPISLLLEDIGAA